MAGGSQIIINKDGITLITPGKFEPKAGQHLFKGGEKANYSLPEMPNVQYPGEFKHEVRQFEKSYDNQQAEQISLMV